MNMQTNAEDCGTIHKIAERAARMGFNRLCIEMDITAVHLNDAPLDLDRLLAADPINFVHDVSGIRSHLDRTTGHLSGCFSPRYAMRQAVMA